MAKFYDALDDKLIAFIEAQPMFFIASASSEGRVNLSPKGLDTFRVLGANRCAYLDITGSGNEIALPAAFFAVLGSGSTGSAQTPGSSVTFTRTLRGSSPEYFAVQVSADGQATYDSHKLDDPGSIRRFQVSPATREKIFSLTHSLNDFHDSELESRHKVANVGWKRLAYQQGPNISFVEFNYSENRDAQQLCDIFERISNVEERIAQLESEMRYDRLDLPQILLQTQVDMDDGLYVEPALMIPTLDRIASDSRYMHLAQTRARELEARIRRK